MSATKSSTPSEPLVCRFYELHTCIGDGKDDKGLAFTINKVWEILETL